MNGSRILIVEDDMKMKDGLHHVMSKEGYAVDSVGTGEEALRYAKNSSYDLVITDMKLPGISGLEVLRALKNYDKNISIIVITAYGTVNTAVSSMKEGADDFITKPFDMQELKFVVGKVFEKRALLTKNKRLQSQLEKKYKFDNIIGSSESIVKVFKLINQVKDSKTTILIQGETGTGKELVARAIHYNSKRSQKPFLPVNCAALTGSLFSSELFGHEKGAFTGAVTAKRGIFEVAEGGTVFLDEIGDIDTGLQQILLRVLEDGEIQPVGSTERRKVSVRVIAATNKDLKKMVEDGSFREDLYYRLNVVTIDVPPLRERKEDIGILARHFLKIYSIENEKNKSSISSEALHFLEEYDWPGNVRELENIIERAVLLESTDEITPDSLTASILSHGLSDRRGDLSEENITLEQVGRSHVLDILRATGGNKALAAEKLGINRSTLWRMMKRMNISDNDIHEE
ncbi:MAG TPA: sigma-54 dependent transcriptional regulator [bacterium]|nr:sigma-54 dependent transcriptional regulator [bacterium]